MSLERGLISSFCGGEPCSLERDWDTTFRGMITAERR